MGILSVLGRKRVIVEEPEPEIVIDPDTIPDRAYLAVMEPDVAGISSFRLRFFAKAGPAERFIATLRPDARRGTHAFWAMHDRPQAQEDIHIEALVLVRASPNSDVVYVVSFLDIESANSFTRFEVKRGLALENILIYWAAFTQIREEFNSINILTATAPAIADGSAAEALEHQHEPEFIIPEIAPSSVEDPSTVDESLAEDIESEAEITTIIPDEASEDAPAVDDSVAEAAVREDELDSITLELAPAVVEGALADEQSGDVESEPEPQSLVPEVSGEGVAAIDEIEAEDDLVSIITEVTSASEEDVPVLDEPPVEVPTSDPERESAALDVLVEDAIAIDDSTDEIAEPEDDLGSIISEFAIEDAAAIDKIEAEDDLVSTRPEVTSASAEDAPVLHEPPVEVSASEPENEPAAPEVLVEDATTIDSTDEIAEPEDDLLESIVPEFAVEDAAAMYETVTEAAELEDELESIVTELVIEDAVAIDGSVNEIPEPEDELESINREVRAKLAEYDSLLGEPVPHTADEPTVDERLLEVMEGEPEPEPIIPEFFSAPVDDAATEEDSESAGTELELQPIVSELHQEWVEGPTVDSEEALLDRAYVFRHNAAVVSEIRAGHALLSEGADAGMIVGDREFASPIISFAGDDETEVRQPTLAELLPVRVHAGGGDDAVVEDEPEPAISGQPAIEAQTTSDKLSGKGGEDKVFRIEHDIERLLHNRRWEKRESPFDGFNSPPGRF